MVVNGSCEAFYIVAHLLKESNTLILTPSFAEYEDSCRLYNHNICFAPIGELVNVDLAEYDSVWLGSPNNPDGFITSMERIVTLCERFPKCYFVVDRAYSELADVELEVSCRPSNLVVIESLTKSFGIPGLRLGYLIASSEVVARLSQMRPPWGVNSLALSVGEYIVDNYALLQPRVDELVDESMALQSLIDDIVGFEVIPSRCNFFLCRVDGSVAELQRYLIDKHALLIRNCSNFRGLDDSYFRVAVQSAEANRKLVEALKKWR